MKDSKGHGSNPRGARQERVKLNRQVDQRKFEPPSTRPWGPARPEHVSQKLAGLGVSAERIRAAVEQSGAHTQGIHEGTAGKTLAQTSAMGATTFGEKQNG